MTQATGKKLHSPRSETGQQGPAALALRGGKKLLSSNVNQGWPGRHRPAAMGRSAKPERGHPGWDEAVPRPLPVALAVLAD